jgi:hypothetical protein
MKKCASCFEEKDYTNFNLDQNRKYTDGYQAYCKPCQSAYYKAYNAQMKDAHPKVVVQAKVCLDCGLEKPSSQFGKRAVAPDKLNTYCKPCWSIRCKKAMKKYVRKHA